MIHKCKKKNALKSSDIIIPKKKNLPMLSRKRNILGVRLTDYLQIP